MRSLGNVRSGSAGPPSGWRRRPPVRSDLRVEPNRCRRLSFFRGAGLETTRHQRISLGRSAEFPLLMPSLRGGRLIRGAFGCRRRRTPDSALSGADSHSLVLFRENSRTPSGVGLRMRRAWMLFGASVLLGAKLGPRAELSLRGSASPEVVGSKPMGASSRTRRQRRFLATDSPVEQSPEVEREGRGREQTVATRRARGQEPGTTT